MKLKDIFNVDLNKPSGKKLFKKTTDKYNLGNEYKHIIKNIKSNPNDQSSNKNIFKYYKFDPYNTNDEDRKIISNNCYEVLYTYDNGVNLNRYHAKGLKLYNYNNISYGVTTKAICVLITDDLSWFDTLTNNTLVEITKEEYDNIKMEY